MEKTASKVFDLLVKNDEDVMGLFSYSLYRFQKMKFMEEFKTKHNVDRVPKSVIDNFTDNEIIRLDKYEKNALEMLQEHSFSLHLELLKEKIECPKKDEKALLDDIKSKATFKWGRAIGTSALGSFLYLAIAIIITFLTLWGFDFNLKKAGKAFVKAGLETTEKIEQSF